MASCSACVDIPVFVLCKFEDSSTAMVPSDTCPLDLNQSSFPEQLAARCLSPAKGALTPLASDPRPRDLTLFDSLTTVSLPEALCTHSDVSSWAHAVVCSPSQVDAVEFGLRHHARLVATRSASLQLHKFFQSSQLNLRSKRDSSKAQPRLPDQMLSLRTRQAQLKPQANLANRSLASRVQSLDRLYPVYIPAAKSQAKLRCGRFLLGDEMGCWTAIQKIAYD